MSTHQQPTPDTPTAEHASPINHRPTHLPDPSSQTLDSTTNRTSSQHAPESSWVDRCQRQFTTTSTQRLGNLADDENEAMPDGI